MFSCCILVLHGCFGTPVFELNADRLLAFRVCRTTIRDIPTFIVYSLHRHHVVKSVVLPGLSTFQSNESFIVIVSLPSFPFTLPSYLLPRQHAHHTTKHRARLPHLPYTSSPQAPLSPSSRSHPPISQHSLPSQQRHPKHLKETIPTPHAQPSPHQYQYSRCPTASWHTPHQLHATIHARPRVGEPLLFHRCSQGGGWN